MRLRFRICETRDSRFEFKL